METSSCSPPTAPPVPPPPPHHHREVLFSLTSVPRYLEDAPGLSIFVSLSSTKTAGLYDLVLWTILLI
jgi:hypothetical protein